MDKFQGENNKPKPLHFRNNTRVYPKVSGLVTWRENCKWYTSLPLFAAGNVILWVSLVSFAGINLWVAPQRVFIAVVRFVIDSVRRRLDTLSYSGFVTENWSSLGNRHTRAFFWVPLFCAFMDAVLKGLGVQRYIIQVPKYVWELLGTPDFTVSQVKENNMPKPK